MTTTKIPLAGSLQTRDAVNAAGRDQIFTNCFSYAESDAMTGGQRIYTEKRRGYGSDAVSGVSAACRGSCVWQSNTVPQLAFSYVNTGGTAVQIYNQAVTQIGGDIASTSYCYGLIDAVVSGTGNLVGAFKDSGTGATEGWYFAQGGAWTQIVDSDFPANVATGSGPVALDGYIFWIGTDGKVWNMDLNSVSSVTANNFITAQSMPDGGVGLARTKDALVAFGTYSIEFFKNTGNPTGSPLSSVPDSVIRVGAGLRSITTIGDSTYFQGIESETGTRSIYRLQGGSASVISTPDIDEFLGYSQDASCCGSIRLRGMEHVLFGIGVNGATALYAFNTKNNRWWKLTDALSSAICAAQSLGGNICYMASTSNIFKIDSTATNYQDNGTNTPLTIQTAPVDFGTDKRKFCSKLRLIGDRASSANTVTVSFSDDDAITFTTAGTIDMSTDQDYLTGLGSFKRRVWKFTNAVNLPLRLEAFELEYTVGTA